MKIKVGFGFDVHQLVTGVPLFLGGVPIASSTGALGHSDADVLLHAICDALLGAAGLRDIGVHFSDQDDQWKSISSLILLERVMEMLSGAGFKVGNIDSTLCLESPKISAYVSEMQRKIAASVGIPTEDVSIKATTNEKMGFIGRKEGLAAYAVVLISKE